MGVVWRAHDELLRRDIAVKELHVRIGVDDDFRSRQVLREARAAARLRHPGVVAVHDVVVDAGRPMIVMELVEGFSLAELIRRHGPLPEQRVAEMGVRVLAALAMAHAQGVVHRDVKPGNVLLDGSRVVLTDFGIAAVSSDTTVTDSVIGSPEYLAPERVNGQPASPASDLWSLGVTLSAALRGESPFQRSDTQSTLAAVMTYEPAPIPQAPNLWPVIEAMLHKDPRRRPTAAQAGQRLSMVAGVPPFEVPRPSSTGSGPVPVVEPLSEPTTRTRVRNKRARTRLVALLAVLVLLMAGGIWLLVRPGTNAVGGTAAESTSATSAAPTAPPGFAAHKGDKFTMAVPRGWFKDSADQNIFWVADPHSRRTVLAHVEWWDSGHPGGARGVLDDFEKGEFTREFISKYKRLKLATQPMPRGITAADLEVTYHLSLEGEFDYHELNRAVVTATGRTYILTVAAEADTRAAAERLWRTEGDKLKKILDSFQVTP